MQLKDLLEVEVMNLLLFDLDHEHFCEYNSKYDDYFVVQIFSDEIEGELRTCIDITKNEY